VCELLGALSSMLREEEDEEEVLGAACVATHAALSLLSAAHSAQWLGAQCAEPDAEVAIDAGADAEEDVLRCAARTAKALARAREAAVAACILGEIAPALLNIACRPSTPPPILARTLSALLLVYPCTRRRVGGGLGEGGVDGTGEGERLRVVMELVVKHVFLVVLESPLYSPASQVLLSLLAVLVQKYKY
jgi:microcompartment protein CcmK/EutM